MELSTTSILITLFLSLPFITSFEIRYTYLLFVYYLYRIVFVERTANKSLCREDSGD